MTSGTKLSLACFLCIALHQGSAFGDALTDRAAAAFNQAAEPTGVTSATYDAK